MQINFRIYDKKAAQNDRRWLVLFRGIDDGIDIAVGHIFCSPASPKVMFAPVYGVYLDEFCLDSITEFVKARQRELEGNTWQSRSRTPISKIF